MVVDHVDPFLTPEPTHLRVGWAYADSYQPRLTGGDSWGGNGVGDDLCSYGFDGLHLWSGEDESPNSVFCHVLCGCLTFQFSSCGLIRQLYKIHKWTGCHSINMSNALFGLHGGLAAEHLYNTYTHIYFFFEYKSS